MRTAAKCFTSSRRRRSVPTWVLMLLFSLSVHAASPARAANDVALFQCKVFTGDPAHQELIRSLDSVGRGYYGYGSDFEPNGFLVDVASDKARAVVPKPSEEEMVAAGRAAVDYMHEQGITAWLDAASSKEILTTYRDLAERGELNSHVVALPVIDFQSGNAEQQLATALEWREQFLNVSGVKVVGIKVFADGVAEYPSQTAVLSKPYRTTGKNGELLFDPAEFAKIAIRADKDGLLVHVHAIGDRAVTEALNVSKRYERQTATPVCQIRLRTCNSSGRKTFPVFTNSGDRILSALLGQCRNRYHRIGEALYRSCAV
jgi:predicted amidohydrolase YtcJ